MPRIPIPDDWDEITWDCHMIEWPSSPLWRGLLRGFVSTPCRGWYWDERSGDLLEALELGKEILERNPIDMSCEEVVTALNLIVAQLAAIDVNVETQITVSQEQNQAIDNQTTAIAQANSTASATASAYANATLISNILVDIRPLGGDLPELTEPEAEEAGISTTPIASEDKCAAAYWLTHTAREIFVWLDNEYIPFWFSTSNAALATLGLALKTAGFKVSGPLTPILLAGAALTALVEYVVYLEKELIADVVLGAMADFITDNFSDIRCLIYNDIGVLDTAGVLDGIINLASIAGAPVTIYPLIRSIFNLNNLSLVMFQSPFVSFPDLPPGEDCVECLGV